MISKRGLIWSGVAGLGLALTPFDAFVRAASAALAKPTITIDVPALTIGY